MCQNTLYGCCSDGYTMAYGREKHVGGGGGVVVNKWVGVWLFCRFIYLNLIVIELLFNLFFSKLLL